jgi:hypothetical protein
MMEGYFCKTHVVQSARMSPTCLRVLDTYLIFFLFCLYTYSQIPIASKPTWTKNHGEIDKKNPLRLVLILISNSILVISLYFDFLF